MNSYVCYINKRHWCGFGKRKLLGEHTAKLNPTANEQRSQKKSNLVAAASRIFSVENYENYISFVRVTVEND